MIHRLSNDDHKRVSGALHRIFQEIPKQLSLLEVELESQARRLVEVSAAVKKIPDDDAFGAACRATERPSPEAGGGRGGCQEREQELRSLDHQVEVHQRLKKRKEEAFASSHAGTEPR